MRSKDNAFGELLKVILVSVAIVFVVIVFLLVQKIFVFSDDKLEVMAEPEERFVVIIDPGHGGADGGASVNGIYEKDLNLVLSTKVCDILSLYNVDVRITRNEDKMLAEDSSLNKKREDLYNRVEYAKGFKDPIFVSIHMNKFCDSKYKGLQVFYSRNDPYSEALALTIQSNCKKQLSPDNNRNVKPATSSIYILDRLYCPAVLVECGFISNKDDLSCLCDEGYQTKLAFVLANSIIEYIKL